MKASEMLELLEQNPKLRFKKATWKDGTLIGINDGKIKLLYSDGTEWSGDVFKYKYVCDFLAKGWDDWQLVREPVPWQEAIQAVLDGKKVICMNCTGCKTACGGAKGETLNINRELCFKQLQTCTWYIEE